MARGGNHNPEGKGGFQDRPETRNNKGQRSKAAVSFARSLREYIVKHGEATVNVTVDGKPKKLKRIEAVVRAVYNEAIKGEGWAANFIADRVEGKVKDELNVSGGLVLKGYLNVSPDDWDADQAE